MKEKKNTAWKKSGLPHTSSLWDAYLTGQVKLRIGLGDMSGEYSKNDRFLTSLRGLEAWFERQKRVLPWRSEPTPYRVWISEIMLQQTQVATVIPYFEKFVARFPDVQSLAGANEDEVLLLWAGLGYYSRARNLLRAAREIVAMGRFPESREEWLRLPGIGNYTAGAILSISMDRPEPILDGNVERVLSRVRKIGREAGDAHFKARLWRVSRAFVERGHAHGIPPSVVNQAMMELGATVCTPARPSCGRCPFSKSELCNAWVDRSVNAYPPRRKPREWIKVEEEMHCVLDNSGRLLLRKRDAGEWRAGLWDLPGAGILNLFKLRKLGQVETRHVVTRHKIHRKTHVWKVDWDEAWAAAESKPTYSSKGTANPDSSLKWVSIEEPGVAMGSALRTTLKRVLDEFAG